MKTNIRPYPTPVWPLAPGRFLKQAESTMVNKSTRHEALFGDVMVYLKMLDVSDVTNPGGHQLYSIHALFCHLSHAPTPALCREVCFRIALLSEWTTFQFQSCQAVMASPVSNHPGLEL